MNSLLIRGESEDLDAASITVGDRVPIPRGNGGRGVRIPGGSTVTLPEGTDVFMETNVPGVYSFETTDGPRAFAVNLSPAEGRTDPMEAAALEQLGVQMAGRDTDLAIESERRRQLMNSELERRQQLWRWGIVAAIGILIVETWLAGRPARQRTARAEALAT
jgi:hypothetical protein